MKKLIIAMILLFSFTFVYADDTNKDAKLTIENIQNSNEDIDYVYELHIDDLKGAIETETSDGVDYVVFNSLGDVSFTLKGNETVTFNGLPSNVTYILTVEEVDDYIIKINDLEVNKYNGVLNENTKISITSFTEKDTGIVDDSKNPRENEKKNPSTSDKIAVVSLIFFITMLFSYTIYKINRIHKYEDNL